MIENKIKAVMTNLRLLLREVNPEQAQTVRACINELDDAATSANNLENYKPLRVEDYFLNNGQPDLPRMGELLGDMAESLKSCQVKKTLTLIEAPQGGRHV